MFPSSESDTGRRYRPIVELGRGGMAEVFLAVVQGHAGFNKLVVLKKTRPELSEDGDATTMFLDEARLAARLNHPNVVQTYEVGQERDRYFIAMEYLEGQPLSRVRHRSRSEAPFPLALGVRVLAEVLSGLQYAHDLTDFDGTPLGIVHRDVTPHNVFITYEGHVKIVDFGIAKAAGASAETRFGTIKGKVAYMPPEQATARPVDRRADIFAVGVMLWEAIAGARMWKGVAEHTVIHHLSKGEIPSVREASPDVSPELERIVARALAPRPEDRYATAAEMQADLEGWLDGLRERTSPREIARYMAERFAEQRAKVRHIVEAQLSDVRWSGPVSSSRVARLPRLESMADSAVSSTTPGVEVSSPGDAASPSPTPAGTAATPPPAPRPLRGGKITVTLQSGAPPKAKAGANAGAGPVADADDAPAAPVAPARGRGLGVALGGAAIVAAGAAFAVLWLSARPKPPEAGGDPAASGAASAGSPSASAAPSAAAARATSCPDGMLLIPGGRFFMGSDEPAFDLWKPVHRVTLDTFCIDAREVTAADYKACADTGNCRRPDAIPNYPKSAGTSDAQHDKNREAQAELCNFGKEDRAKHPINCVTWDRAEDYCRFRGARLPTEAEWEYAARGSDGRKFPWGDEPGAAEHMNACGTECNAWEKQRGMKPSPRMYEADDGWPGTAPVGSFPRGKTTFGAYDFIGNVWEWTSDWFETYKPGDATNPTGAPAGNRKAIRGGGFNGGFQLWLDPAFRFHQLATASAPAIGFRCAAGL